MKAFLLFVFFSFLLFFCQAQFTTGNLVVYRAGSGTGSLVNTGNPVFLDEYSPTGTLVQSIAVPTTASGGNRPLIASGTATSEGLITLSSNNQFLVFTGYGTTVGGSASLSGTASATVPRVVGLANYNGIINTSTALTDFSDGNNPRTATSTNGTDVWVAGGAGGVRYTTAGATTSTQISTSYTNLRDLSIFNGQLYVSSASSSLRLGTVGTGTPTTSGQTISNLPGLPTSGSTAFDQFFLCDLSPTVPGLDVLFVADEATGITKYSLVSGTWVSNGIIGSNSDSYRGLTGIASGSTVTLYATRKGGTGASGGGELMKIIETGGYNGFTAGTPLSLVTASSNTAFRGVAFAPIPAPSVTFNPNTINFGSVIYGSTSVGQTIVPTASFLTPAADTLFITAPSTNFQVSSDGNVWGSSTFIKYSGNGSTVPNFYVRFSPQTSGVKSGNITVTGGGLANAATISVSGTGDNSLTFAANTSATTAAINPPYVSGTINDPNDPALVSGIVTDVKQSGVIVPAANYSISAVSNNTSVVPNANISVTKADGLATIKINPAAIGYATITLTLTAGTDTKTYVINYAASQSSTTTTTWLTGMADASTAISLDDDYMVVSNDELNFLYVYNRKQPGLPVKIYDFNQNNILGLTDGAPAYKEVDVEASVRSIVNTSRTYWLGSMSNSSSFNDKPNRNRLFAIDITGTGATTSFKDIGNYANLRQQLITWGDANGYNFTASAAAGVDPKTINGFNAEGMTIGPDNTTLYIAFRAPLVPTANRTNAVIAPIQNFETWFNNGSPVGDPTIGSPIELNLGGRGIREIYRLSNGVFVIAAGSYDGTSNPAIYTWTGLATNAPVLQPSFNVAGLNVEGVLGVNESGQLSPNKIQVICDDGSNVYYADGVEAKDLAQSNFSKFSSDIIVSSSTILPVQLVYFTATKNNAAVLLNWQTASNDDGVAFDVMRSTNGQEFTTIGSTGAVANKNAYSFTDVNAPVSKLYYRIATKSADGQQLLSAIRVVSLNEVLPVVKIYPNPIVNNVFSIETNNAGNKKLGIYTDAGTLFKYYEYTGTIKDVYTNGWPKGTYLLKLMAGDGSVLSAQKIIVL